MSLSLNPSMVDEIRGPLKKANLEFAKHYPGELTSRQPVHTVYGGAHLFKADTAKKIGDIASRSLQEYAPDAGSFARCLGMRDSGGFAGKVYARVAEKLMREAVEDFRIDFEDGYGNRPDAEEDGHAAAAAAEVAQGITAKTLPPFIGIRIKPFSEELFARSLRTLDIFLTTLSQKSERRLPENFVITLPKVTIAEQVTALARALGSIESKTGLKPGSLKLEIMVETPQSIIDQRGHCPLPSFVMAGEGRCIGAHFGTYDYTASCNITAAHQSMTHGACDYARNAMQVSLAGMGLMLSDGATNVMPVGPHKAPKGGTLTPAQMEENRAVVYRAWKLAFDHTQHSLVHAYYQGWDLHPAQLPVRYGAVYSFFLEGLDAASLRLKTFVDKAAQATLVGDVFDDAATGQGLLNFFLRGIACGAITEDEARATGLTLEEIRSRSFLKILNSRRK